MVRMNGDVASEVPTPAGSLNPAHVVRSLWGGRELILQLTRREISARYRGTYLGIIWSFITPLLMLVIYTFVFSIIFRARWEGQPEGPKGRTYFAICLFAGLIPFSFFAEMATRAPGLILGVPSYVRKVVFPLEVLPIITLGSALFHSLVSVVILLIGLVTLQGCLLSPQLLLLPVAYVPLILFCLGLAWLLAALGPFMRDLSHGVVPLVQMLSFLTPIFYPISAVPQPIRPILTANPLTLVVAGFRQALLNQEHVIGTGPWLAWTGASALLAVIGYAFFVRVKRGFADVL